MILIIAGTNRRNSNTEKIARIYQGILGEMTKEDVKRISLADLEEGLVHGDMYDETGQAESLKSIQEEYFIPANRWVLISPEYNGSYPGIVKLVLDSLSARAAEKTFQNKKVALVGLSSGRTGNWLGMNQLTSILHYLKMHVYHNKVAVSHISSVLDEEKLGVNPKTIRFFREQIKGFLEF